jgi:hypothetical protein
VDLSRCTSRASFRTEDGTYKWVTRSALRSIHRRIYTVSWDGQAPISLPYLWDRHKGTSQKAHMPRLLHGVELDHRQGRQNSSGRKWLFLLPRSQVSYLQIISYTYICSLCSINVTLQLVHHSSLLSRLVSFVLYSGGVWSNHQWALAWEWCNIGWRRRNCLWAPRCYSESNLTCNGTCVGRRVIVNYACHVPALVPRLCLLQRHTHPEYNAQRARKNTSSYTNVVLIILDQILLYTN